MSLKRRIVNSEFAALLRWQEEQGKGRRCMLLSNFLSTVVNAISTGSLYTAFLAAYDFSIADVSFLGVIPALAACFCIFSPVFLERFQKRKWLLAGGRLAYYLLELVGLTLLAIFAKDPTVRLVGFSAILLAANLINSLFSSGYSVWHLNFMPVELRATFLSYQQIISTAASILSLFGFGFLADCLKGTAYEAAILTALRVLAVVIMLIDVLILCLPKEYPYPRKEAKIRLSNIVRLPLKNRTFMLTMAVVCLWTVITAFPSSSWNYYLLHNVGTGVTLLNIYYPLTALFLLFSPFWRSMIARFSWFRTFAYCAMLHVPGVLVMSFITTQNYIWLYTVGIIIQAFAGVGLNLCWSNFAFINTPLTDQTYYLSFFTLSSSLGSLLGSSAGAWFVRTFPEGLPSLFGRPFDTVPCMLVLQSIAYIGCITFILVNNRRLQPEHS